MLDNAIEKDEGVKVDMENVDHKVLQQANLIVDMNNYRNAAFDAGR
jgi:hypothetical protein